MHRFRLQFKYGTSRGVDTYGYSLVTLYVDGDRVARERGGGYDMFGAALGTWITTQFQTELLKIANDAHRIVFTDKTGKWSGDQEFRDQSKHLYGMTSAFCRETGKFGRVTLDGACGRSSMEAILRAIGYELIRIAGDVYTVERKTSEVA